MRIARHLLTILMGLSLGLAGCASGSADGDGNGTVDGSAIGLSVVGTEYSFNPATLTVRQGDTVTITFTNEGTITHDLTSRALGFGVAADPGVSGTATFTASEKGTFPFICSIRSHADVGMYGTITVE